MAPTKSIWNWFCCAGLLIAQLTSLVSAAQVATYFDHPFDPDTNERISILPLINDTTGGYITSIAMATWFVHPNQQVTFGDVAPNDASFKPLRDEIKQARKHGDPQTITQLQAAEDAFLAPHLVATAEFEGARLRFRSDGLVENSKDQIARRWWIPAHRHTDLVLERAGDSDEENGAKEEFHIADDGRSLTQAMGDARHVWEFVQD